MDKFIPATRNKLHVGDIIKYGVDRPYKITKIDSGKYYGEYMNGCTILCFNYRLDGSLGKLLKKVNHLSWKEKMGE